MENNTNKIRSFRDLNAWQKAYELAILVYKVTKKFPMDERFALTDQARRAVVSVSSNVAEGFSRNSQKDKIHFYTMANGSLFEVQSQLMISEGLGYISKQDYLEVYDLSVTVNKLCNGLIKSLRNSA